MGPEALTMPQVAEKLSWCHREGDPLHPEEARQSNLARGVPPYLADGLFELFAERRMGKEGTVSLSSQRFLERAQLHSAILHGETWRSSDGSSQLRRYDDRIAGKTVLKTGSRD